MRTKIKWRNKVKTNKSTPPKENLFRPGSGITFVVSFDILIKFAELCYILFFTSS